MKENYPPVKLLFSFPVKQKKLTAENQNKKLNTTLFSENTQTKQDIDRAIERKLSPCQITFNFPC